jgi:hypothetical protein
VCVDHGRANVVVPQQFLDGADVVAVGQKVRGERRNVWLVLRFSHISCIEFWQRRSR